MGLRIEIEMDVPDSSAVLIFNQVADWVHAVYPHHSPACSAELTLGAPSVERAPLED